VPAVIFNTTIEQGSSYEVIFNYADINGLPIDVSNYCILIQWLTDANDLYIFSNRYDGTDYNLRANSDGTIVLRIPSKTTQQYSFINAVYDLDIQEPNETYPGSGLATYRLATGTIFIAKRNTSTIQSNCADTSAGFNLQENCDIECGKLDTYSIVYEGSGFVILDNAESSSSVISTDTRLIENIEIAINGLRHNSPQDLVFILEPPAGNSILLSANSKISKYRPGFSCMFSNRSPSSNTINNIASGSLCSIVDKTNSFRDDNSLSSSFSHLFSQSLPGNWSLRIKDTDIGVSGSLDSWKLIITYKAE
jgi:subtilisin-like proprotein convertase family protein